MGLNSELLAREGLNCLSGARLPMDEVHEVFERRPNHYPRAGGEAEAFVRVLEPGDDLHGALKAWLKRGMASPCACCRWRYMPNWRRHAT